MAAFFLFGGSAAAFPDARKQGDVQGAPSKDDGGVHIVAPGGHSRGAEAVEGCACGSSGA